MDPVITAAEHAAGARTRPQPHAPVATLDLATLPADTALALKIRADQRRAMLEAMIP